MRKYIINYISNILGIETFLKTFFIREISS